MNIFRDSSLRNSAMLLCGLLMGTAIYFDYMEREPYSPIVALAGLLAGFFSVSVRQCIQNAILSNLGFVLSFALIIFFNAFVLLSKGAEAGVLVEKFGDVLISGAMVSPVVHITWLLAMPIGYGLRRMIKGERVKKNKSKKSSRR